MYFSQRLKVIEEYRKWIEEIKEKKGISVKDCYETFLAFLETKGYLKEEKERSVGDIDLIDVPYIEFPYKMHSFRKYGDFWVIVYCNKKHGYVTSKIFNAEPEADAFLADLKGGKR